MEAAQFNYSLCTRTTDIASVHPQPPSRVPDGPWTPSSWARRSGTVDDIAPLVVFLLSDASSFITGVEIPVDGGLTVHGGVKSISDAIRPVPEPGQPSVRPSVE